MACIEAMEEEREDCSESTWTRREQARQRQIAIGKARPEYRRYVQEVPRESRDASHPNTPDPRARISKRQFDRTLSAWRCRLHEYDVPRADGAKDADITPLARRAQIGDDLGTTTTMAPSEYSEQRSSRCFTASGDDGGVRPLRLADALLAVAGTPVTPQVGTGHHHMHASAQAMVTGAGCPLQLGPRQLDFGMLPKQAWQAYSPFDGTPTGMCAMSPITPAPRTRPVLLGARHQTVYENETPDRPQQPQYHAFGQQQFMCGDSKGCLRYPSPSRQESRAPATPPRTPPRKFLMEMAAGSESGAGVDAKSVERHRSPPSVAKTPSHGMWVGSTPSPQPNMYRGTQAHVFAGMTNSSTYVETRSQYMVEMPPMLPQQMQYSMNQTHAMPWGMFPSA